jgi:hypothetical protein
MKQKKITTSLRGTLPVKLYITNQNSNLRFSLWVRSWVGSSSFHDEALDLVKRLHPNKCYCVYVCISIAISVGVSLKTSWWPCLDAISAIDKCRFVVIPRKIDWRHSHSLFHQHTVRSWSIPPLSLNICHLWFLYQFWSFILLKKLML